MAAQTGPVWLLEQACRQVAQKSAKPLMQKDYPLDLSPDPGGATKRGRCADVPLLAPLRSAWLINNVVRGRGAFHAGPLDTPEFSVHHTLFDRRLIIRSRTRARRWVAHSASPTDETTERLGRVQFE